MTWQKAVLGLVLILFLAMTGEVLYEHGYLGFFAIAVSNSATQLMMFDLVIALTLVTLWMVEDANAKGKSVVPVVPFVLITLFFGAAGPLLYLITRSEGKVFQRIAGSAVLALLMVAGVAL